MCLPAFKRAAVAWLSMRVALTLTHAGYMVVKLSGHRMIYCFSNRSRDEYHQDFGCSLLRGSAGICCLLLIVAVFASVSTVAQASSPFALGVVQELNTDDGVSTGLRMLFRRTETGWTPICPGGSWTHDCQPLEANGDVQWHVWGKNEPAKLVLASGDVKSGLDYSMGWLRIASGSPKLVGEPTQEFAGWLGGKVHKPIVVTSGADRGRAHLWRPMAPEPGDVAAIWQVFRRSIPKVETCATSGQNMRPVRPSDVQIARKMLGRSGVILVHAIVSPTLYQSCDGPPAVRRDLWVVEEPLHEARALPGQIEEISLTPLAFGDFGDGESAALFWFSGYDKDGFILFNDGFSHFTRTFWTYQ